MSVDNKKLKVCPQITDTSVTDKGEIRIQWTDVPHADKYAVKRSDKIDGEFQLLAWATGNEYIDKSAKENVTYWYRIVALKVLQKKRNSKKMSPLAAQVNSKIPAPEALKVKNKDSKIRLEWKCPVGISSFTVYRRNEYFNQLIPIGVAEGNSFTDKDVVQGQPYYYSVQSLSDGGGHGNFSKEVSCVSLDSGEIISAKARFFRKVDLKARIVAGADGYIFERSEDGESFEEIAKTDSDVSLRHTDCAKKAFAFYFYRVRAYKSIGTKTFVSKPSPAVKIKTK